MSSKPPTGKNLRAYVVLQSLVLFVSWMWFAALSSVAFFRFTVTDLECWLLVALACAGFFGLRPNLEKIVDEAWLGNNAARQGTSTQLRNIKRWIDRVVSLIVIILVLVYLVLWYASAVQAGNLGRVQ